MFERCVCKSCKKFAGGACATHKDLKVWIKPNTDLFNYNVKFRSCFIKGE